MACRKRTSQRETTECRDENAALKVWVHETWPRNFEKMRLKVFYPKVLDQTAAIAFSQQGLEHILVPCQVLHSLKGLSN